MNNQILVNMIMNMKEMGIAVEALYAGSKKLVRATKNNKALIFLSAVTFGTILYTQNKNMKKLENRVTELEYKVVPDVSESCEDFKEDEEE